MRTFSFLVGQLLLRTIDRGQRIHQAMLCRGFDGTIRTRQCLRITSRDLLVFCLCTLLLLALRCYDVANLLGQLFMEIFS